MELVLAIILGVLALAATASLVVVCTKYSKSKQVWDSKKAITQTEDEFRALTKQVEELRKLRNNLEGQVEMDRRYLNEAETTKAVAEIQIKSANTQFKETQEKVRELEALLQERKNGVDAAVAEYEKDKRGRLEAELAAATEAKQREATEALVKELEGLRAQVEAMRADKKGLDEELKRLDAKRMELAAQADAAAQCYAEALRRQALDVGSGGQIHLERTDRDDAALIRKMARGLRCENAVLKATYDVYVKPEIERVVREAGVAGVSGIYRIWRKDGERELSYIGQAVDVGERWKTHAKRAWGVDNTGRIKLYQAMMESGIEEWHWELVEAYQPSTSEASAAVSGSGAVGAFLSEREKYWGSFYAVKEVGLNSKLG